MYFRSILSGTLAALLLSGAAAFARDISDRHEPARAGGGFISAVPSVGLPGVFGSRSEGATVQMAQAGDPRITALEEQIRSLNGTIEELNFQILQMQEQMRKLQEDNEFRFQELEQKKSDAGGGNRSVASNNTPRGDSANNSGGGNTSAASPGSIDSIITQPDGDSPAATADAPRGTGEPPRTFGTISVDKDGNVLSGSVDDNAIGSAPSGNVPSANGSDNTTLAALPSTNDPEELYRNSYQFILSGDYGTAEAGFRDHIARFPKDAKAADAHFWLGESLLGQQKYRDAAEVFLAANKDFPKAKKAPDMLLKLGVSLVGLKQRDVACATFGEVGKRYPDISGALKERVKREQALAKC
jgi:tol-pal system protein YbgF